MTCTHIPIYPYTHIGAAEGSSNHETKMAEDRVVTLLFDVLSPTRVRAACMSIWPSMDVQYWGHVVLDHVLGHVLGHVLASGNRAYGTQLT